MNRRESDKTLKGNAIEERLHARLDDLATGQLGWFAAYRLRRRIRRDPDLRRAWNEVRALHQDLHSFALNTAQTASFAQRRRATTILTPGEWTMPRRAAAFAVGCLMLLSVTASLASHYWRQAEGDLGFPGVSNDWWEARGRFSGTITALTPAGEQFFSLPVDAGSPAGALKITLRHKGNVVAASATVVGMGKHPVYDGKGHLAGYIVLSPLTAKGKAQVTREGDEALQQMVDYYQHPEQATPDNGRGSFSQVRSLPDMVGATPIEWTRQPNGEEEQHDFPFSWKTYGDVHVVAKMRVAQETYADRTEQDANGQPKRHFVTRPEHTVIDEVESVPVPDAQTLADMPQEVRHSFERFHVTPHATPETYWQVTDPSMRMDLATGRWVNVLRSGKFVGYGHFAIRDTGGKVLMTLDITRPTRRSLRMLTNYSARAQPQRSVAGWNEER